MLSEMDAFAEFERAIIKERQPTLNQIIDGVLDPFYGNKLDESVPRREHLAQ